VLKEAVIASKVHVFVPHCGRCHAECGRICTAEQTKSSKVVVFVPQSTYIILLVWLAGGGGGAEGGGEEGEAGARGREQAHRPGYEPPLPFLFSTTTSAY